MRFHDYAAAPSPRKVRLFIAEKGLSIPPVEIDLRARAQLEPDFLANPGATVPVLELDDETCLTESLAICHYLEAVHPDPNLLGTDPKERALVMWTDIQTLEGYLALQEGVTRWPPRLRGPRAPRRRLERAGSGARGARPAPRRSLFQQARDAARRELVHRRRSVHVCRHRRLRLRWLCETGARRRAVPLEGRPAFQDWHERIAARPAIQRSA